MLHPFKPTRWIDYLMTTPIWRAMTDGAAKASNLPVLGDFVLKMLGHDKEHYDVTWFPINKRLEDQGTTIVPVDILREYIRKSSHRVIMDQCPCRQGCGCQDYPKDLGCIYLGEATKDMDPSMGRHATVDEALAQVERALECGLQMGVGQVDLDALYFGLQPASHFMTVCFCCQCCCVCYRNGNVWSPNLRNLWHKLEGVEIKVTDDCVGCGECVNKCFVGALSVEDGKARIDEANCKGCGICVENCPADAISIKITDEKKMHDAVVARMDSRVDVVSSIPGKKENTVRRDAPAHPRWGHEKVKIRHSREK
jgi:ferredoxin